MDTQKVASEISRLINSASRRLREADKAPGPQDLTALAKLTTAYTGLLEIEMDTDDQNIITEKELMQKGAGYEVAQGMCPSPKVQRNKR